MSIKSVKRRMRKSFRRVLWLVGLILAPLILALLGFLPRKALHAFARGIGSFWYYLIPSSRNLGLENLDLVYGESITKHQKAYYCRESFNNILICMLDYLYFSFHTESIKSKVHIDAVSEEKILKIIEKGQGALIFSAHMGNWELLASYFSQYAPANLLSRDQKNFAPYMEACRSRHGVVTLYNDTISSIKKILLKLSKGELVGIALDRNLREVQGIMIDFMGHPAFTPYYPVKLAMAAKVPVIGMFLLPEGAGYRLYIEDPVEVKLINDRETTYRFYTQAFLDIIEKYIRKHPEQWFWAHKRWGRPKGIVAF